LNLLNKLMDNIFYVVYISLSGVALLFSIFLMVVHLVTGDYKVNSFKLVMHLLLS
jgi:hypothetical protein